MDVIDGAELHISHEPELHKSPLEGIRQTIAKLRDSDKALIRFFSAKDEESKSTSALNDRYSAYLKKRIGFYFKKISDGIEEKNISVIAESFFHLDRIMCEKSKNVVDDLEYLRERGSKELGDINSIGQKMLADNKLLDKIPYLGFVLINQMNPDNSALRAETLRERTQYTDSLEVMNENGGYTVVPQGGNPFLIGIINNENATVEQEKAVLLKCALKPIMELNRILDENSLQIFPVAAVVYCGSSVKYKEGDTKKPWDLDLLVVFKNNFDYWKLVEITKKYKDKMSPSALNLLSNLLSEDGSNKREYALIGDKITSGHEIDMTIMDEGAFTSKFELSGQALEDDWRHNLSNMRYRNPARFAEMKKSDVHRNFVQNIAAHSGTIIWGQSPVDSTGKAIITRENRNLIAQV